MGLNAKNTPAHPASPGNDAHQIALDFAKQIITLSSGVLALTGTFLGELSDVSLFELVVLGLSWATLILSVFTGIQTISAIVLSRIDPDFDWTTGPAQRYATISKYSFFIGIILFALFAFLLLLTYKPPV